MKRLALPLVSILLIQSTVTMAGYGIPVIAPDAAADLGMAPESVGFLVSTVFLVAMAAGLATGTLVAGVGPTRLFQLLLVLAAAGGGLLVAGTLPAAVAGAVLIGCATGPLNPAGSHVLQRVSTPATRAMAFSLKQCGTPAGGMLAGAVLPPLILLYDWRVAFAVVPAAAIVLAVAAPWGGLGAREAAGHAGAAAMLRGTVESLRIVLRQPALRAVALAGACFAGCQLALSTYLVLHLRDVVGLSPERAGAAFALLHVAGIAARILLGFVADRFVSTVRLLAVMGVVMAVSLVLIGAFSAAWPLALVLAVTAAMGASGNGWVGLFFLELAKLSPPGQTAEVAGGGQFVMYSGIFAGPLLFGAFLAMTGSYQWCFAGSALIAALASVWMLLARGRSAARPGAC